MGLFLLIFPKSKENLKRQITYKTMSYIFFLPKLALDFEEKIWNIINIIK